jgi:hypothetical protein
MNTSNVQVLFTNIINRDSLSAAGPVKKSGNHPDGKYPPITIL